MGLSENEQRILDQLETQLRQQDPGLARRASRFARQPATAKPIVRAGLLFLLGFSLLLLLTFSPVFGILGAAVMLVGLVLGGQALGVYAKEQAEQARQKASRSDEA